MHLSHTWRNGIRVYQDHLEGYGGPGEWRAWAVYSNRVLAKEFNSEGTSVARERWRVRFSKMLKADVELLAKNKPQFIPLCDQCEKPMIASSISQGSLVRCETCHEKTPYTEVAPEVTARAEARRLIQLKKAVKRQRAAQKKQNTTPE